MSEEFGVKGCERMMINSNRQIEFHCPRNGELVVLDDCEECNNKDHCDIRVTMMDENFED